MTKQELIKQITEQQCTWEEEGRKNWKVKSRRYEDFVDRAAIQILCHLVTEDRCANDPNRLLLCERAFRTALILAQVMHPDLALYEEGVFDAALDRRVLIDIGREMGVDVRGSI